MSDQSCSISYMSYVCIGCGRNFKFRPKPGETVRFCSMACRRETGAKKRTKICPICGNEFEQIMGRPGQVACSRQCAGRSRIKARSTQLPAEVDGACWIPLSDGSFALVDEADRELVSRYDWWNARGYAKTKIDGCQLLMHRLLVGASTRKDPIDHI